MTEKIHILTVYPPTVENSGQKKQRGPRKPKLATIIKRAKQMGVDVTFAPDGSMTFKCSQVRADDVSSGDAWNEWDAELYGTH